MKINKAIAEAIACRPAEIKEPEVIAADSQAYVNSIEDMNKHAKIYMDVQDKLELVIDDTIVPVRTKRDEDVALFRTELDEKLFELGAKEREKKPVAESVDDLKRDRELEGNRLDVYTVVYDRLFPGNRFKRPTIAKDIGIKYDYDKQFTQSGLGTYDIGVYVNDKAEAKLARRVADELLLQYELKDAPKDVAKKGFNYLAIIRIPDRDGEMLFKDYCKKYDLDYRAIVPRKSINK